jgi:hypothetical protein
MVHKIKSESQHLNSNDVFLSNLGKAEKLILALVIKAKFISALL